MRKIEPKEIANELFSRFNFFEDRHKILYVKQDKSKTQVIPFPENNVIFERVKASGFNDRKWVHIALILTHLRSLNRESFHVAQI